MNINVFLSPLKQKLSSATFSEATTLIKLKFQTLLLLNLIDSQNASKPLSTFKTAVPVWKAKYTPFGDGLATVIVPQLQRNDHSLFLWNHKHLDFPVHSFFGHKDVILEFGWRKTPDDNLEMVTFSRDHTLR